MVVCHRFGSKSFHAVVNWGEFVSGVEFKFLCPRVPIHAFHDYRSLQVATVRMPVREAVRW